MARSVHVMLAVLLAASAARGGSFVNWESPHVDPLALTPDGSKLLAVNTADNRLEVFAVDGDGLSPLGAVPVGLDPVSVRARTDAEAWVVNHVSDTVSIVDLETMNVTATLHPGDEPASVVFAGDPQRAFVSVSQENRVLVYDPANLSAPPVALPIQGEDPRALAADGSTVYVAVFESGNGTTILSKQTVSSPASPYAGAPNPPPNAGSGFDPPPAPGLPEPPEVGLVVRKGADGVWRDDNGADWSAAVTWDLHDHDVAIIDAATLSIQYATGLMNHNMALGVRPGGGVTVVGTEALNEIRFEPNLGGTFVRVVAATVTGSGPGGPAVDLNPHLDYATPTVPQPLRDMSIGDPRGIVWSPDGARAFISGLGSGNVVVVDAALERVGLVEVGEGPTGMVIGAGGATVYALNRFEGSVSVIDAGEPAERARVFFHDPTPAAIRAGRPFLYDTHRTSGLGQASCASCHVDGRMDQLAWDLGNPAGEVVAFDGTCQNPGVGCGDWHPMKGPLVTQTLVGIIGTEPLHWRGDRADLAAFNPAFESLLGGDEQLTAQEMADFEAFVATLTPPPNPFRELDGSLSAALPDGGDAVNGESMFPLCTACHAGPSGTSGEILGGEMNGSSMIMGTQSIKVPQLRNLYEKTGFDRGSLHNNRGFGFLHDGSFDTLRSFFDLFPFDEQQKLDLEAFMLSFSTDTPAGVGAQATLPDGGAGDGGPSAAELIALAAGGAADLVVKGVVDGERRGYYLASDGTYQSDRAAETADEATLLSSAGPGAELTFTLVPAGSAVRIGVDRDQDGHFDRDELDAGSDPADPASTPGPLGDLDGDGAVGVLDFLALLAAWGPCPASPGPCPGDLDGDGAVGQADLETLLDNWG